MSSTTSATSTTRTRPPAATLAAVTIQVLVGTVTSAGSLYFGLQAGRGWIVSAALFAAAWPLWILSAAGLTRRSARARKIGLGLATALLAFSVFKIVRFHESASYLIASLDLMLLACLTAAPPAGSPPGKPRPTREHGHNRTLNSATRPPCAAGL